MGSVFEYISFLVRDAFVRTNRRAISVCLSVWDERALRSDGARWR